MSSRFVGRRVQIIGLFGAIVFTVMGSIVMASEDQHTDNTSVESESIFPAFQRDASEADRFPARPADFREAAEEMDIERQRILRTTNHASYFVVEDHRGWLCLLRFPNSTSAEDGLLSMGCSPPWDVPENGVATGGRKPPGPLHMAYALPEGYENVVDGSGNLIAGVEQQLVTVSFDSAAAEPEVLTAKGPAGEIDLDIGFMARDGRPR